HIKRINPDPLLHRTQLRNHNTSTTSCSHVTPSSPVKSSALALKSTVRLPVVLTVAVCESRPNDPIASLSCVNAIFPATLPLLPAVRTVSAALICHDAAAAFFDCVTITT